jgi:ElaB/YqjD/DUF883 family membrane-anchored ribosome-binding protein
MSTRNQIDIEAQKDPEVLEREIDQQRNEIGNIVHALESKLSPGELIDTALGYVKGGGGEFFTNLGNTVKANPVPTLLTSIGVIWLMAGQNRQPPSYTSSSISTGPSMTDKLSATTSNLKQQGAGMKEKASQIGADISHTLGDVKARATDSSRHAADTLRHQADRARGGFSHLLQEQPLAVGAIGIALGALIAAAVPPTRREDEMLGKASDEMTGKLRQKAEEGYAKASQMGEHVVDQVKDEVRHSDSSRPSNGANGANGSRAGL